MGEAAGEVTGWDEREKTSGSTDADPVADDPEVVVLVEEIEETRGELTNTVEQIGDKLDPRNIVANAKETVREATVGKVEQMANTAGDMVQNAGETAQQAGSGLLETVRRNPIPAAMAGIGIGWLAMNMRNQGSPWNGDQWRNGDRWRYADRDWRSDASWQASSGDSGGGIGQQVGDKVGQVGDTASQALSSAQHTAQDVAERVGHTAGEVPRRVEDVAGQVGSQASRMFQENPLAVGAIAVAVGTAVGLALPVTQTERRVLGEARDSVIDKAETAASQALSDAEQQARTSQ